MSSVFENIAQETHHASFEAIWHHLSSMFANWVLMADIFLSYASQDRERVLALVEALQEDGYSVWWDRNIPPGPSFDREIESAITAVPTLGRIIAATS